MNGVSDTTTDSRGFLRNLDRARENINFTLEMESLDGFLFLDLFLSHLQDGPFQRSGYNEKVRMLPEFSSDRSEKKSYPVFNKPNRHDTHHRLR